MKLTSRTIRDYKDGVEAISFGKRVGTHLYLHRCAQNDLPQILRSIASLGESVAKAHQFTFDILKFGLRRPSLSLLSYPGFFEDPFPILEASARLDLATHAFEITDYSARASKPVLHRKELMLPQGHAAISDAQELTRQAEELGLFEHPTSIGTQRGWERVLSENGVELQRGRLVRTGLCPSSPSIETKSVQRHRTALSRDRLSVPFQLLQKYGYLEPGNEILDYGCGRGDDVRLLNEMGIPTQGWDPHYFPATPQDHSKVVNLGYVLNVIEDLGERAQVLRRAFELAGRVLCVSVLTGRPEYAGPAEAFKDGVRTVAGTFQKYFLPDEIQNYVRSILGAPCVPIAQGTVLAFKSMEELERFRAKRAGLRGDGPRGSCRRASELYVFDENAREVLNSFWEKATTFGREPLASELDEYSDVGSLGLSPSAAFRFLLEKIGADDLRPAIVHRISELLVEFALAHFDGRVFFKYLDESVQKDIESFFDNYSDLRTQARDLLFSIANTEGILRACQDAAADGLGYLLNDHSLQLHVSLVKRLPPLLQVFEGSAERLLGGRGQADLVKLHVTSGKVSYLGYDDFAGLAIPSLVERIKVDLPRRKVDYFDYIGPFAPKPLLMKSLFMDESVPRYSEQAAFDRELLRNKIFDPALPHPSWDEVNQILAVRSLKIKDFALTPVPT